MVFGRLVRIGLKILHEASSVVLGGAFAACLVLAAFAPHEPLVDYVAAHRTIARVAAVLFVPALAVVVMSGLLALAATRAYTNAGWAWAKAFLGMGLVEGTFLTAAGFRHHAEDLASMVAGTADPDALAEMMRMERNSLYLMLFVCALNVVLGVWRPRLFRGDSG